MKPQCPICGGSKQSGTTTVTVDYSTGILVVRNVPATICSQCGEEWIDDPVAKQLELMTQEARAGRKEVEVLDFAQTAAA